MRDPFLIKVFFGTEIPVEDMLILLRRQKEEQQKMLAFSRDDPARKASATACKHCSRPRRGLFWTLTLEMAIAYRRAYIDWCEQSMHLLEESFLGAPPIEDEPPVSGAPPVAPERRPA